MCDVAHLEVGLAPKSPLVHSDAVQQRPFTRPRRCLLLAVSAAVLCLPLLAGPEDGHASAKGAFPGFTGAPGEDDCRHCHDTYSLNPQGGGLMVVGFPETYTPGDTYTITVTLASDSGLRWGFQATALTERRKHAGKFIATDRLTTKVERGFFIPERTYIGHKQAGTFRGHRGSVSWTFDWRAPKRNKGVVTLYVAGNASNDNGNKEGDPIYATRVSSQPPAE
jgi:hypothetical protein